MSKVRDFTFGMRIDRKAYTSGIYMFQRLVDLRWPVTAVLSDRDMIKPSDAKTGTQGRSVAVNGRPTACSETTTDRDVGHVRRAETNFVGPLPDADGSCRRSFGRVGRRLINSGQFQAISCQGDRATIWIE